MKTRNDKGLTLIELLVVLVISSLLIAGLYRTFIGQQKTYTVQEQVVDMQQNARVAINRMMREIRMAGFGNVSMVLPVTFSTGAFNNVVNPDTPVNGSLTIVTAIGETATLTVSGDLFQNQITVSRLTDDQNNPLFDTGDRKYISIGGLESYSISSIDNGTRTITLNGTLLFNHPVGTPVFGIRAISYRVGDLNGIPTLIRNENMGEGDQPQADNIENLQFTYWGDDTNNDDIPDPPSTPADIRMVRVALTARTERQDPELLGVDGYRRRQIASNIRLRNMGLTL